MQTAFFPYRSKKERCEKIANYHLSIKIVSRGKGKSVVAAAAYRSGEALTNENEGISFDYSRKGGIVYTEILLPENAPIEFTERSKLWNTVEKIEKSSKSQLARDVEFSLPVELTQARNIELAKKFVQETFVDKGMIADICYHDKNDGNPHVHILLTMRPFNEDGSWGTKQKKEYILDENGEKIYDKTKRQYACRSIPTTDWNEHSKAEEWRAAWADYQNAALARAGFSETVDHKSYERQGIEKIPTIHMGAAVMQMEARGIRTDRGDINREIAVTNNQIKQLRARANKVKTWLDENKNNTPPTLAEVLHLMLTHGSDVSRYKVIADIKLAAKTLVFIQQNKISDLPTLAKKVEEIHHACNEALEQKKKTERRIKTLDKHVEQSENFKKYRKVKMQYEKFYAEYKTISTQTGLFSKSKTQKALDTANEFYNAHKTEIVLFETAEKYLRDVLQKRFDPTKLPPITAWRKERDDCETELIKLNQEYITLKNDVQNTETIKRFAVNLMLPDELPTQQKSKTKGLEI